MKLSKKIKARIFDSHFGLAFNWRETGRKNVHIFLWMLFFAVLFGLVIIFIDVKMPSYSFKDTRPGVVTLLPSNDLRWHRYVLRNTPLPVRGPIWADPVSAGPVDEKSVALPVLGQSDTELKSLPTQTPVTATDQVWNLSNHPDAHIKKLINDEFVYEATCVPYLSFCSPGLEGENIVTGRQLTSFAQSENHTGLKSEFFVVVNTWGVPMQVLMIESSGSEEADTSALQFAQSLRWVPTQEERCGTLIIEWKEEE